MKKLRSFLLSHITKVAIDFPIDSQVTPILSEEPSYQSSIGIGGLYDSMTPLPDQEDKTVDKLNFGRDYSFDEPMSEEEIIDQIINPAEPNMYGEKSIIPPEELDQLYKEDPRYGVTNVGTRIHEVK